MFLLVFGILSIYEVVGFGFIFVATDKVLIVQFIFKPKKICNLFKHSVFN